MDRETDYFKALREKQNSKINLPEDYILFCNLFYKKEEFYKCQKVFLPELKRYDSINYNYIEDIKGDTFTNIEIIGLKEGLECWRDASGCNDEHYHQNFFPIGWSDTTDLFCIGFGSSNFGKIYLDSTWPERFILVADNIFEFLSLIKIGQLDELPNGIKTTQLYKNWGEDFWRVRAEKEES